MICNVIIVTVIIVACSVSPTSWCLSPEVMIVSKKRFVGHQVWSKPYKPRVSSTKKKRNKTNKKIKWFSWLMRIFLLVYPGQRDMYVTLHNMDLGRCRSLTITLWMVDKNLVSSLSHSTSKSCLFSSSDQLKCPVVNPNTTGQFDSHLSIYWYIWSPGFWRKNPLFFISSCFSLQLTQVITSIKARNKNFECIKVHW